VKVWLDLADQAYLDLHPDTLKLRYGL